MPPGIVNKDIQSGKNPHAVSENRIDSTPKKDRPTNSGLPTPVTPDADQGSRMRGA
jgi:hypothetical protein